MIQPGVPVGPNISKRNEMKNKKASIHRIRQIKKGRSTRLGTRRGSVSTWYRIWYRNIPRIRRIIVGLLGNSFSVEIRGKRGNRWNHGNFVKSGVVGTRRLAEKD